MGRVETPLQEDTAPAGSPFGPTYGTELAAGSAVDAVIRTEGLTKVYRTGGEDLFRRRNVAAVHDLNMEVRRGEVFAMIGPNGSGKTTTLKLLLGLIFPTSGTARLFGRDPRKDVSVKRRIGFMPDGPYFYGHLNGYELLEFYAELLGIRPEVRRRRIPELLDMVGMSQRARNRIRTYSKGMVQRVGLAHALLNDPEVVFLDEPTSGLDPVGSRDIRELIARMKEQGKTVFLCSHFLTEIEHLCDRVILLDRGRTLRYGALEELLVEPGKMRVTASDLPEAGRADLARIGDVLPAEHLKPTTDVVVNDGDDVTSAIQVVRQYGGHLDAVVPMRRSLEEVFMEAVEHGAPDLPYEGRDGEGHADDAPPLNRELPTADGADGAEPTNAPTNAPANARTEES